MERGERETVILINDADISEGFYRIGTSVKRTALRLEKRFKGYILETPIQHDKSGKETYFDYRISSAVLPRSPFLLKKRATAGGRPFPKRKPIGQDSPANFNAQNRAG